MSDDPLGARIGPLFRNLAHAGDLGAGPALQLLTGEAGEQSHGTRIRFTLGVVEGLIRAVRYRAYGCPFTLATCEWLAGSLEGRPAACPGLGGPLDWAQQLGIPADRLGRLLVIEDALRAALTRL